MSNPTPDDTGSKQSDTKFKPGQSGNPKGRPKGARSKLGEAFLNSLLADFETHGAATIAQSRSPVPTLRNISATGACSRRTSTAGWRAANSRT